MSDNGDAAAFLRRLKTDPKLKEKLRRKAQKVVQRAADTKSIRLPLDEEEEADPEPAEEEAGYV